MALAPRSADRFQVARFLRMQPWFALLPPASQDNLVRAAYTLRAPKAEIVLPAGEPASGWYAVLSGLVKLQSPAPQGQACAFVALPGSEWFGEGTAMTDEPRRYEVVALRDSELLCLPHRQFNDLLAASLPFSQAVLRHMNLRLGQAMSIIETHRAGTLEQRLALYLTRQFWHGLRKLNLSQDEFGCLAGMSRQAANRALRGLEARGLIALRFGRVVDVDQDALEGFVGMACHATRPGGGPCRSAQQALS